MLGQADPDVTAGKLDPAGDLEEAQAKRCDGRGLELGVRQASLQLFEQSIGGDVQEQSELVGFKPLATCPVCGELTLPLLDPVFYRLAAQAIVLVHHSG